MSIEGTLLEKLLEEQRRTNELLETLVEAVTEMKVVRVSTNPGWGNGLKEHLTDEQKSDLDDEINLDWWFLNYGEENLPAKYMHAFSATGQDVNDLYSKAEGDYIFSRMKEYLEETNEQGTHAFKYLGKVWCKREGNARNCFAFVPVKKNL